MTPPPGTPRIVKKWVKSKWFLVEVIKGPKRKGYGQEGIARLRRSVLHSAEKKACYGYAKWDGLQGIPYLNVIDGHVGVT